MIKVYRIEHPDSGIGPFNHQDDTWSGTISINGTYTKWGNFPDPYRDSLTLPVPYKVGCTSLKQLNTWFSPKEREHMRRAGFRLRIYIVPKDQVAVSDHQCLIPEAS